MAEYPTYDSVLTRSERRHDLLDIEPLRSGPSRWDTRRSQQGQARDVAGFTRRDGGVDKAGIGGSAEPTTEAGKGAGGDNESGRIEDITGEALSKRSAGDGRWDEPLYALRRDGDETTTSPEGEADTSTRADGNLTITSTVTTAMMGQPQSRSVPPFGGMVPVFDFVDIAYTRSGDTLSVSFKVNCTYPYGVNGGACIDVPSATDGVVTAQNHEPTGRKVYEVIKDDLMPAEASPHKSPRDNFWSRALTARHERYHGTDDYTWARSAGKDAAKAYVDTQTISSSDLAGALARVIAEVRRRMYRGSDEYYWGGTSDPGHSSRAGEVRAYGDGRPLYTTLANAAYAHGRSLAGGGGGASTGGRSGGDDGAGREGRSGGGGTGRQGRSGGGGGGGGGGAGDVP